MMALRRQLPVYSPLSAGAVLAGVKGALAGNEGGRASIEAYLSSAYSALSVLLVDSGTSALRLAIAGVRATVGARPVALPAYSCYDVASAAEGADADALLYDVDPSTLGPNDRSLRQTLEGNPCAVVAAHLYGYPVDVAAVQRLARDAGAVVIEDAAQGAGGCLRDVPLGSLGSVSVLSFGRGKGTTGGAGGALLAHDEIGARVVAWAASQPLPGSVGARGAVVLGAQWILGRPSAYWIPSALPFLKLGETVYHPPRPPRAMSHAALASLAIAFRANDAEVALRRRVAERIVAQARGAAHAQLIDAVDGAVPGYLRLPVRVAPPRIPELLGLLESRGVAAAYPTPLLALPSFRGRVRNASDDFSGARALAQSLVTFPTHRFVAPADVDAFAEWFTRSAR